MKILNYLFVFIIPFSCFSQVGGERVFNFLNITTSARQASLGGEVLTLFNEVNQPLWNPSLINNKIDNKLSLNYLNFLTDVNYGSASYAHKFSERVGTIHTGLTYVNYGKFISADEQGNEIGTFKASDLILQFGYAYELPFKDVFIGTNVKLISSVIENFSSTGIATDIGLSYYNESKPYIITAVLRNFGYQISAFDEVKEELPMEIAIGGSYSLENLPLRWHFALNNLQKFKLGVPNPSDDQRDLDGNISNKRVTFLDQVIRHMVVGAEFFPDKGFNLRFGYNFRRGRELRLVERRTFSGFTAGFGLKMGKFKFNYAFSKFHPASNTNTFSLQIDLAKKSLKKY